MLQFLSNFQLNSLKLIPNGVCRFLASACFFLCVFGRIAWSWFQTIYSGFLNYKIWTIHMKGTKIVDLRIIEIHSFVRFKTPFNRKQNVRIFNFFNFYVTRARFWLFKRDRSATVEVPRNWWCKQNFINYWKKCIQQKNEHNKVTRKKLDVTYN